MCSDTGPDPARRHVQGWGFRPDYISPATHSVTMTVHRDPALMPDLLPSKTASIQ